MTENPPEFLVDCANSMLAQILDSIGGQMVFQRKKKGE